MPASFSSASRSATTQMSRSLNLIVACAENRVIGRGGQLPWRIPEDWKFFKNRTAGATVILGRISYLSWKSILEDNRRAIVLTRNRELVRDRVEVVGSLDEAVTAANQHAAEIFICGGQKIFEEAIVRADVERLYLTLVHANVEGDRTFPAWQREFPVVLEQREGADEQYRYTFYVLGRERGWTPRAST